MIGAGVIGSLFAGHLAQVADVSVLTRRQEHADALTAEGLRVSGRSDLHAQRDGVRRPGRDPALRPRHRRHEGDRARGGRGDARGPLPRGDDDDDAQRARRRGGRPRPRRLADHLRRHVHERHAARRHARRVHPRHGDVARAVRGDAVRARRGGGGADPLGGPEGRGAARPAAGAVVEAHLQRDRQLGRGADGPPARPALRGRGAPDRSRPSRPRPRRRGQGRRRGGRHRAPRRPVGDERPRDAAGLGSLSIDAGGRRSTQADRGRPDHRSARARGGPSRGRRAAAHRALPARQGQGGRRGRDPDHVRLSPYAPRRA